MKANATKTAKNLGQNVEDLSELLSKVLKHPKMPVRLYNVMADELCETYIDTDSPENISGNLKALLEKEKQNQ